MKDLPPEALTLISRARHLEKLIKDAMVESPDRATLGELLRENQDLFDGYRDRLQWAGRIRNGCAHVTDDNYSTVEIKNAIQIFDAGIAEMTGATVEVASDCDLPVYEPPATPYAFSNAFYIKAMWSVALLAIAGIVLVKLVS